VAGAAIYVPVMVGAGYAVGYGFGAYVERLRYVAGEVERIVLIVVLLGILGLVTVRVVQAYQHRRERA
jgi:ABC-type nitrate/sulfonate/bicarbonate transport system permease component